MNGEAGTETAADKGGGVDAASQTMGHHWVGEEKEVQTEGGGSETGTQTEIVMVHTEVMGIAESGLAGSESGSSAGSEQGHGDEVVGSDGCGDLGGLDDQGSVVEDSGSLDAGEWKLKTKRRRKKRRVRRVFRRTGRLG